MYFNLCPARARRPQLESSQGVTAGPTKTLGTYVDHKLGLRYLVTLIDAESAKVKKNLVRYEADPLEQRQPFPLQST